MDLRIFNVSDYIYAGGSIKDDNARNIGGSYAARRPKYYGGVRELPTGGWGEASLPTGGIAFMLNAIFDHLVNPNRKNEILVFCVDAPPTIKRSMYATLLHDETGYKSSRAKKSPSIITQKGLIRPILEFITPNVVYMDGYEADDTIANIVWQNKRKFDHIYIHNRDSDLYCLVDDNVSMTLVGDQGKIVTKDNYSSMVQNRAKGYSIAYNSILLDKVVNGDPSDSIPRIPKEMSDKVYDYIPLENYKFLGNPALLRAWVGFATDNNPYCTGIVDLVSPLTIEDEIPIYDEPVDIVKYCYIAHLVGNKYAKSLNMPTVNIPEVIEVLDHYTDIYYMEGGR